LTLKVIDVLALPGHRCLGTHHVSFNELLITRRGNFNEPRNIEVYLLRQIRGENLNNISELFNIKAYSTVSSIIRRVSRLKKYDKKIRKQIGKIQDNINKGQKQT